MGNFSFKLSPEKIDVLKQTFKEYIKPNKNEYIDTFIQKEDLTISIYTSNKVVFQGNDAFFYAQAYLDVKKNRQAGSDEVGTGDVFGPVVVCAAIVEEDDYPFIEENHITDSKQLTDQHILNIGQKVIERFKHSVLILDNLKYNEVHQKYNLNAIKAQMHNQAYINLKNKGYSIPKAAYVDQFCSVDSYYEYLKDKQDIYHDLIFETKAESSYPAVAVASVISRYTFLKYMEKMNKDYQMVFHKGASDLVDEDIKLFVAKYGKEKLKNVSKMHFKNVEEYNI